MFVNNFHDFSPFFGPKWTKYAWSDVNDCVVVIQFGNFNRTGLWTGVTMAKCCIHLCSIPTRLPIRRAFCNYAHWKEEMIEHITLISNNLWICRFPNHRHGSSWKIDQKMLKSRFSGYVDGLHSKPLTMNFPNCKTTAIHRIHAWCVRSNRLNAIIRGQHFGIKWKSWNESEH